MLVREWMSKKVITIDSKGNLQEAANLMMDHHISRLPVLENGKLVGIVTDRDVRRAAPSNVVVMELKHIVYHMTGVEVSAIMTSPPLTVPDDYTVEEAAEMLVEKGIFGCPVLDRHGKLAGVITKNDVLKALMFLSGVTKRGVKFGFLLEDRPGSIKEVTDILRRHGGRLASIMSSFEKAPPGYRHTYIRVFDIEAPKLPDLQKELHEKAQLLYMISHDDDRREIYIET